MSKTASETRASSSIVGSSTTLNTNECAVGNIPSALLSLFEDN